MLPRPPGSIHSYTLFPYTTLFLCLLETLDFLTDGSLQALSQLLLLSIDGVSERFLELVVANVGVDALVHRISHVADKLINLGFTGRFQAFFQGFKAAQIGRAHV